MNHVCFIYAITNTKTGRRYVGSSINLKSRWRIHQLELMKKRHHCQHLQNSWNKHGEDCFKFSILQELPTNEREPRAKAELTEIKRQPCFNKRISKSIRLAQTKTVRKKMSKGTIASWKSGKRKSRPKPDSSPEAKAIRAERMRIYWASPAGRKVSKRRSNKLRKYWNDPKSKFRKREHKMIPNDESRRKQSEALKAMWADPTSPMHGKKNGWDSPKARENLSRSLKAAWIIRRARMNKT